MYDAYPPVVFTRHDHQLRAVMIHHQPWFVAHDFARLIGAHRPYRLPQKVDPHQRRAVWLRYASGLEEEVEAINDAGVYRALYRFNHPEHRCISRWISDEVLPVLHDHYREPDESPQRALMTWADRRIGVLKWQGEVWIPRRELPRFLATRDEGLDDRPSWRQLPPA